MTRGSPRPSGRKRPSNIIPHPAAATVLPAGSAGARKGIQSVEIGLRVLNVLARADGPLALKDVSRSAGISPSQAHRYLTSLIRQEMVVQDPMSGRYDLGKMALRVGLSALNRTDTIQVSENALRSLVERLDETGMLCIWGDHGPIAVRWRRGKTLIVASIGLGSVLPLLSTVSGQVFLAFMPPAATTPLLEAELAERAARGRPVSEAEVAAIIERVRQRRYADADGHIVPGIRALSAPVLDFQGEIVAALTLIGNSQDARHGDPALGELLRAAVEASERLGFNGQWPDPSS